MDGESGTPSYSNHTGIGTNNDNDQTRNGTQQRTSQQVIRTTHVSSRGNKNNGASSNRFLGDEKEMNCHVFHLTT